MKKKWLVLCSKKITKKSSEKKIISLLLKNREISVDSLLDASSAKDLDGSLAGIKKSSLKKAVKLINEIGKKKRRSRVFDANIIVYGDYDADGLCATAILWQALWQKKFNVLPYIPDRINDGYGINPQTIKKLKNKYPDLALIITVDNGIVAHKAVKFARKQGIKVIITDHHLPPPRGDLPLAEVIVHSVKLSGSGVAWFLAREFGYRDLDLAAIGTIADMLPLQEVNRNLVKLGLSDLGQTRKIGLKLLMQRANLSRSGGGILPWQVSFILAPRLNAVGRLADAMDGLRLLCTVNREKATVLAGRLDEINKKRQQITNSCLERARKKVGSSKEKLILTADKSYHQGIIGLVAGKLAQEFYRPAIVIWRGDGYSKGSARSVSGCNIIELIRKAKDLLVDLGGHPMAAGFTIETKNIEKFIRQMKKIAEKRIKPKLLIPQLKIDFEIDFSLINENFYQLISKLAPFGFGNPEPVFLLRNARVTNLRTMGKSEQHLKLWLDDPRTPVVERLAAEAVGFGWGKWRDKLLPGGLVDLVFNLNLNHWNGRETIQLKIKDLRKA